MRLSRLLISLALLAPALSAVAGVSVDWDAKAPFASYRTWAFKPGTPARSELNQARLESVVTNALSAEGLSPAGAGPDLWIVTHAASEVRQGLRVTDYGYGYGAGYYRYGYGYHDIEVDSYEYKVGTLIIDLVDAKTGKLAWRGEASDTIGDDPKKLEKKVAKVVTKMFQQYPPPPAK